MASESDLLEKLGKIEALFAGSTTPGEKAAAGAAADRIRARLKQTERREKAVEIRFSLPDPWSRRLFCALCRRYELRPYRYSRMQRQSIVVRAPSSFVDEVLLPEFQQLNNALTTYLAEITETVISEAIHGETSEAEVVADRPQIGR
ncbi:hypothetical protein [Ovoidimarina sediminis]|uniref:hypothetical protein n=1 Tax=Ovoidimarina sediminis TaxID=3079856 RepID=UPI0029139BB2|nr:hypothetical protein [Rhodophyticola sp. MJ-SS7]MDU8946427.1 hypothetical protein [Rhodophyticola sp. MJ-SS7]